VERPIVVIGNTWPTHAKKKQTSRWLTLEGCDWDGFGESKGMDRLLSRDIRLEKDMTQPRATEALGVGFVVTPRDQADNR
jgi:hypothetical protein